MSGLLGAIWNLIKKVFSTIFKWLKDFLGKFWWIILIIVAIYFAPAIVAWLGSVGAPSFLVTAFEGLATLTPYVTTAVQWLWSGVSNVGSAAWSAYSGLSTGMQAAIAVGAAALIAPDETAEVLDEGAKLVVSGAGAIAGATLGAITGSPVLLGLSALAIWYFFFRDKNGSDVKPQDEQLGNEEVLNGAGA